MVERGLVKKVSFSSLEKERGQKVFFSMAALKKKIKKKFPMLSNSCQKLSKSCQKVDKTLSKRCQKVVKKLSTNADKDKLTEGRILSPDVAPGKNLQILK
jgi:hypothetical protein